MRGFELWIRPTSGAVRSESQKAQERGRAAPTSVAKSDNEQFLVCYGPQY